MEARTGPESFLDGYEKILTDAAGTGRRPDRAQVGARRASGEQAAEAGLSLRSCVAAHLAATRRHWPAGRASPADVDRVLGAAELAIDAFAEGYERAQRLAARQEEADRREFVDDLLHGRSHLGRLAERAERFGLLLSHAYAVAVAEGAEPYDDFHAVTRQVGASLVGRFGSRNILITTKDGRIICVAPGDQTDVLTYFAKQAYAAISAGGRIAVGRAKGGGGGVAHSYEEALSTLELAARMGFNEPVLKASDLLVFPVLARDRQALADLVHTTLGPLRQARGGAVPLLETLTAYFDAGCVSAEAARTLSLSVRALTYRLRRIHVLTGCDPADPAQRYTLQTAVIGARLLDWPARS
ncbi:PucR family transcriptional regulator [Streptomyces roseoverticillatus]|uniref:PucR family transcriptional regulator n=1 Tax=Streptomyces roseoverticillatus TaxID=66429 RepID=UPI0004C0901F|nr:helix-turn-helix domain-containing protein [Streptomyces roseoverticillatus]